MLAEGLGLALYAGLVGGKLCHSMDLQIEPQGISEKGMNSATSCVIPDKRKNSCSRSRCSILIWCSRTRQPDSTSLHSFSESGTLASVKRLLKLQMSQREAFQRRTSDPVQHKRHCQHLFTGKTDTMHQDWRVIVLFGSEKPSRAFTGLSLPQLVSHLQNCGNATFWQSTFRVKLLREGKLFLALHSWYTCTGELQKQTHRCVAGKELECTLPGPPPMIRGSADMAKHTYPTAQSPCSNLP